MVLYTPTYAYLAVLIALPILTSCSQSLSEQNSLLRLSAARNIFQRIRDDTSTVREQMTVRSTAATTETAPASIRRIEDQTDSFSATSASIDMSLMVEENQDRAGYGTGTPISPWQRPAPFEML